MPAILLKKKWRVIIEIPSNNPPKRDANGVKFAKSMFIYLYFLNVSQTYCTLDRMKNILFAITFLFSCHLSAAKPDIHCLLKSKQKVPVADGYEVSCNYKCANGGKKQIVNPISYGCPTRIQEKNKG